MYECVVEEPHLIFLWKWIMIIHEGGGGGSRKKEEGGR